MHKKSQGLLVQLWLYNVLKSNSYSVIFNTLEVLTLEPLGNFIPIHHIPECGEVIGPAVLVFKVVRMFPNIHTEDGRAFYFCDIH